MAMSWSTTKGVTSTVLHMLADRGSLEYDSPVASYWPEFAANGKGAVTVRQVMAMEAGLYDVRHLIDDPRELLDHETMAAHLACGSTASRARPGECVSRVHVRVDRRRIGAPDHRDDARCVRATRDCSTVGIGRLLHRYAGCRVRSCGGTPSAELGTRACPDRREGDRSVDPAVRFQSGAVRCRVPAAWWSHGDPHDRVPGSRSAGSERGLHRSVVGPVLRRARAPRTGSTECGSGPTGPDVRRQRNRPVDVISSFRCGCSGDSAITSRSRPSTPRRRRSVSTAHTARVATPTRAAISPSASSSNTPKGCRFPKSRGR